MSLNKEWWGYWRSSKLPSVKIPFGVRSVGRADARPGWSCPSGETDYYVMFWCIMGTIRVNLNSRPYQVPADHIIIMDSKTVIKGLPHEESVKYRWITFDGLQIKNIVHGFGIKTFRVTEVSKCPAPIFNKMETLVKKTTAENEYLATGLAYNLLNKISQNMIDVVTSDKEPLWMKIDKAIDKSFSDPEFNIDALAKFLKKNRSYLSRYYFQSKKVKLINAIKNIRIEQALSMLLNTGLPAKEICQLAGFSDVSYFTKCIKKHCGITPAQYRELHWH